jgi:hypothetical protein
VIFAAPQFLAPHVFVDFPETRRRCSKAFQYTPWLVANLFLSDRPKSEGFPLSWDNVLYDSPSLGYVVATHQLGIDHGPTILTYYLALCDGDPARRRQELLQNDWEYWANVILDDLEKAHPEIRSLTEQLDVMRWGHAMIRPTPGFIWGGARETAAQPWRNVHFANTDLSGVPLFEEAFWRGIRTAEEAAAELGLPCDTMLS